MLDKIRAAYAAYDAGDAEGFAARVRETLAPDCTVTGPQYATGDVEEAIGIWLAFASAFPDGRHEWSTAVEHDGVIAFQMRYTGTHTGPLATPAGELPGTGRTVELDVAVIARSDGHRVTAWHDYVDSFDFMVQLGLMPEVIPTP
jgi:predicted ester cyclase